MSSNNKTPQHTSASTLMTIIGDSVLPNDNTSPNSFVTFESEGHERRNGISIPISPQATFANHTKAIVYHKNYSRATDVLVIYSACPRPYYVVRLLGPTLIGMQTMAHYHLNHSRIERMYYNHSRQVIVDRTDEGGTLTEIRLDPVVISGLYWLEVLQLTCNTTRTQLEQYCLPNSLERLTLNKLIELDLQEANVPFVPISTHGYWKRNETVKIRSRPIRTRLQIDFACKNERANCDGSLLQDYAFVNQSLKWPQRMDTNKTFCLVGDSHMDRLSASIGTLFQQYDPNAHNDVHFFRQHFPHQWDEFNMSTTLLEYNCSFTILSLGIWSISHQTKHPLDRLDWFHQMEHITNSFVSSMENNFLLLLLTHPVPLGFYTSPCPPRGWFVPYMIDEYNQYLQLMSELHPAFQKGRNQKAQLIDSYPILRSVWDAASDWMHLDEPVQTPEAHFILNRLADIIADKKMFLHQKTVHANFPMDVTLIAWPVLVAVQTFNLGLVCFMAVGLLGVKRFGRKVNRLPFK